MLEFKGFTGQIILLCKGHYFLDKISFLESIRKIWAIRCGIDYELNNNGSDVYIANELFKIIQQCLPEKMSYLHEIIHRDLDKPWYSDLNSIERLIMIYRNEIWGIPVSKDGKVLIKLPNTNHELFLKIIQGNGEFNDYKLVEN